MLKRSISNIGTRQHLTFDGFKMGHEPVSGNAIGFLRFPARQAKSDPRGRGEDDETRMRRRATISMPILSVRRIMEMQSL
jgi:hypothetical protein